MNQDKRQKGFAATIPLLLIASVLAVGPAEADHEGGDAGPGADGWQPTDEEELEMLMYPNNPGVVNMTTTFDVLWGAQTLLTQTASRDPPTLSPPRPPDPDDAGGDSTSGPTEFRAGGRSSSSSSLADHLPGYSVLPDSPLVENLTKQPFDPLSPGPALPPLPGSGPAVAASSSGSTIFQEDFNDNFLSSSKWTVVNQGYGVAETNQRLEMKVRENMEPTATVKSSSFSATFSSTSGVDANVRMARDVVEGDGWAGRVLFRVVNGQDPSDWVEIGYHAWADQILVKDSAGNSHNLVSDGRATGYHDFRLVVTGSQYTGHYGSYSYTKSSSIFNGASSAYLVFKDKAATGSTGAWEKSARDDVIVYSYSSSGGGNTAPNTPEQPSGPSSGETGNSMTYSTRGSDPDGDSVRYEFDWGDGSAYTKTGWVSSNSYASNSHSWSSTGTYYVRARTEDTSGATSSWSTSKAVTVSTTSIGDSYEPDDSLSQYSTMSVSTSQRSQSRSIDPAGDVDYIRFYGYGGYVYTFHTTGSTDTYGRLYTNSGSQLSFDDDSGDGYNFRISYTLPSTGYYFLKITGYSGSTTGPYTLYYQYSAPANNPPSNPTVTSSYSSGTTGTSYSFTAKSTDSDGDNIRYYFSWGDGSSSWSGWKASGLGATMSHSWSSEATYTIWVLAEDSRGARSNWASYTMTINAPSSTNCPAKSYGGDSCDVVLLHGWAGKAWWPGTNGADEVSMNGFNPLQTLLSGYYSDVRKVGYYGDACGTDDSVVVAPSHSRNNLHSSHYDNHHVYQAGCQGNSGMMRHDKETDIRHLGYHLAWYIWDEYTSDSQTLDIAAHSMGGLVARYATARVDLKHSLFPSHLDVEDIVTMGSPHLGGRKCLHTQGHQAEQMCSNGNFMNWLAQNAERPAPSTNVRTEWTAYGSACDGAVSPASATTWSLRPHWWVSYDDPPCYGHSDYYKETGSQRDATYTWGPGCDPYEHIYDSYEEQQAACPSYEYRNAPRAGYDILYSLLYDGL